MNNFFKEFKGDSFGGLTAGIVALPLALAFGVSSGLGPSAGLYGAIFIGFFAALFGGTPTQISGPTAPMTAVSMVIIAGVVAANDGDVSKAMPAILTIFLLAGIFQILLGVIGLGKAIKYIPYPVVSGFMTAIGVMILVTQILPAIGYYAQDDTNLVQGFMGQAEENLSGISTTPEDVTLEAKSLAKNHASGVAGSLRSLPQALGLIDKIEIILSLLTIVIIYGFKRITTVIPSTLVALLVVSGGAYGLGLDYRPIEEIPSGIPMPELGIFTNFDWVNIQPYLFTALSLALLGAIDSLLTSVVADNLTKTTHKPNQELIGQGIGNAIAAIFGGLPGAGATIRTVVNISSGGKTRLSGMIASLLLLVILLALGPVASQIPAAVLAGILITVGIGVMDYKGLKAIPVMHKDLKFRFFSLSSEVLIMFTVLFLSVFWDLVAAVGLGIVISALMFMKKMSDFSAEKAKIMPLKVLKEQYWDDEKDFPVALEDSVIIKHLDGPLFFGNTSEFLALSKQIPTTAEYLILRMDSVGYIDQSGLHALEDVLLYLEQHDIHVLLVAPQEQPIVMLESTQLIPALIPEAQIFEDIKSCLEYLKELHLEPKVSDVS